MSNIKYTVKDFKSDQEVRWCPGCGDHGILNAVQRALPHVAEERGYDKARFAVISGIGCSSRFPYYMDTFGFHSIHGRAAAIATGAKVANPNLSIWQISGDGDALAIGGNHFIHAIRRNIDINIILFNNEIYGLTKGQYSPTSRCGAVTKTSPFGTVEQPFNPGQLLLGANGKFFARSLDVDTSLTADIMVEAARHDGTSVVEVLQNCVIFNNGIHNDITHRDHRADRTIVLRHGEPMIFGKDRDKGLVLDGFKLRAVDIGKGGWDEKDILIHDAEEENPGLHMLLVSMAYPELPVALGVIRNVPFPTYDDLVRDQVIDVADHGTIHNMEQLLHSGDTWEI
ncbi:MAG: 2-oxoacid:ferredoxin oxidoreductase subunit beta [Bacteroidia bacterium]|nr:MAG: 2-oxoacid:ferredoxin oxidoreductase subunit beta [Bacteroidia bacterium]